MSPAPFPRMFAEIGNLEMQRRAPRGELLAVLALAISLLAIAPVQAQSFKLIHEFTGAGDGVEPISGVILDQAGNLYGVTYSGGSFNYGTMFRIDTTGKEIVLHNFTGPEGLFPDGGLTQDSAGNIYGTASEGGTPENGGCAHGCGVAFKAARGNNPLNVLYAFTGKSDGGQPNATMIQDAAGNFYGTTFAGGDLPCFVTLGCGVVFKLDKLNHETVLHIFTGGTDGDSPAGVVADAAGNLYGTTYSGGMAGHGDVYKLTPDGTIGILYSFTGGADSGDPKGPLIIDAGGNLYGTTYGAFTRDNGIVYKLDPAGNFTRLYAFTGKEDGAFPSSLVIDAAGNLYGTALAGGASSGCYYGSCGDVFKIDTRGNFSLIHSFTGTDGQLPIALTIDKAGRLYGTTLGGGKGSSVCTYYKGCGVVFQVTP